jgi:hypothetical protein
MTEAAAATAALAENAALPIRVGAGRCEGGTRALTAGNLGVRGRGLIARHANRGQHGVLRETQHEKQNKRAAEDATARGE